MNRNDDDPDLLPPSIDPDKLKIGIPIHKKITEEYRYLYGLFFTYSLRHILL